MLMEGFSMVFGDPLSIVLVAAGTLIGTIFWCDPRADCNDGCYHLPADDFLQ